MTSASLMVPRGPRRRRRPRRAAARPRLGVGPAPRPRRVGVPRRRVARAYEAVGTDDDAAAVRAELARQLAALRAPGRRDPPHRLPPARAPRRACALGASRRRRARGATPPRGRVRYCGAFYGQGRRGEPLPEGISPDALASIIRGLPEGFTELCCHPSDNAEVPSSYAAERPSELRSLCDIRVQKAVVEAGVRLCSFREVVA